MDLSSVRARQAFTEAAESLVEIVASIGDDEWDRPSIGDWTIRELAVHASRGASTVSAYAAQPAELTMHSSADYYVRALDNKGVHEAVADRAREQAAEIEGSVADYVAAAISEAEEALSRTPANHVLGTFAGGIRLIDYLPTRVVELVVHGLDLTDALDREPVVAPLPMAVTLKTLADVAVARPGIIDAAQIVRALTGRGQLPGSANLLG